MSEMDAREAAILRLIEEKDPRVLRSILAAAETWNRVAPVRFIGEMAVLNPVLDAMVNDPAEFARISTLVDSRREKAGLEWMWPPEEPEKFDRNAYQRRHMQARRDRSGRAWKLENAQRSDRHKIEGSARLEWEANVLHKWGRVLENRLADLRRKSPTGSLPKEVVAKIRSTYWAGIDAELDALEAQLRKEGKL